MAGICYDVTLNEVKEVVIAGNKVTNITRETAQVGCTKVTRAEAEALLAEMNKQPENFDFKITLNNSNSEFLSFYINHKHTGWASVSNNPIAVYYHQENGGFGNVRTLSLCLEKERAEKLLRFLVEQLNYVAYKK